MEFSIALAYQGWGNVKLNPMVGSVCLDKDSKLVSFGYHEKYGEAHAERNALAGIEHEQLVGGSIFVTLEPCSHQGKTPPCSELVKSYPFKRVVIGAKDPNPLVSGKGIESIEEAGIKVELYTGKYADDLQCLNEVFFHQISKQEAFWSMKVATSLDGMTSLANGEYKWITNEKSREHVHYLRAGYSAIAIGSGTLENDNPRLNIRHKDFPEAQSKVLIFSRNKDFSKFYGKQVFDIHGKENIIWITAGDTKGLQVDEDENQYIEVNWESEASITSLNQCLYKDLKIGRVFVEPGRALFAFLLEKNMIQRFYHYQAPIILGGDNHLFSKNVKVQTMQDRLDLECISTMSFDNDILRVYRL